AVHLPFADNSIDLIFSNLMFQWCDPLSLALQECYRVLREGGLLLFSTFGPDTLQELRYCWAQIDNYPHVNNFIDMHHIGDLLLKLQFNDPVMDLEYVTATYKNVTNIMRDLQNIGATNTHEERRKTLTGKNRLTQLAHHYQQFALSDQRLPVTYEIVYGHAWKFKRPKQSSSSEAYIAVDEITNRKA
ncbi:MAG: methyltransferase domain-containing protein, partial [Gammaproteobacteria bacterium]